MPPSYDWRPQAAITFLALPLSLRANHRYKTMPTLDQARDGQLPALSIIIPARNEAPNLVHLLPSLQRLAYPGPLQIIVVDDNSTDHTSLIAQAYGARVVAIDHLPSGWKGKPHACHRGAAVAQGQWLLFTDADTLHAPDSAARAVSTALQRGLDGLSLFIKQECQGSVDRLALMTAYAGLFAGARPEDRLLNGQYILLRRDVYLDSGGFSTVRQEALEDVALGQHLRRLGYTVPVLLGEDVATVRMYGSLAQLWHGMNRLAADSLRWSGSRALWTALFVTALMSPLVVLAAVAGGGLPRRWLPLTWATATLSMIPWARRFGSPAWALLVPVGALFVQAAAAWGIVSRWLGRGVLWKGRRV